MRILLFLLFICPSAFAGYTTMTIDAVQQANGVWTAAGVMDSMGFVRTTGAVSVLGTTKNVPVSFAADVAASSSILRSAGRLMGPVALAATAYDVYDFFSQNDVKPCGEAWCTAVDGSFHPTSVVGSCQLANPYNGTWVTTPDYTPENCVSQNIINLSNTTYVASFDGWITAEKLSTQYQYSGIYKLKRRSDGVTVDSYQRYWYGPINAIPVTNGTPVTDSDFNRMPNFPLPVLSNGFDKLPALKDSPIPVNPTPSFSPFSTWLGDPYYQDGNWYRDRVDISPCPTASQPTRVCVDIGPQKFEGATDPQTIPSQATGTATGSTPKEQTDFCKKNPQSIACAELGELEPEPFDPIEKPFQVVAQSPWGSGDASCPAPKVINLHAGGTVTMSYQPACDFFSGVRPAILALAWLAALYIALGIPVGKGD